MSPGLKLAWACHLDLGEATFTEARAWSESVGVDPFWIWDRVKVIISEIRKANA